MSKRHVWEDALERVPLPSPSPRPILATLPTGVYTLDGPPAAAYVDYLMSLYGKWSITFLDPSYRIFISAKAAISFKVIRASGRSVAVIFGNPLCAPTDLQQTISTFRQICRKRGWAFSFVGVRSDVAVLAKQQGWATIHFADEPMIDPTMNLVLDGRSGRRTLLHIKKLARSDALGVCTPASASTELQQSLQRLYDECYACRLSPYSTKLRLFALHNVTYFYLGDAGSPTAVAGLVHTPNGAILDPCVASSSAPAAATDFLTIIAMGYARKRGIRLSFGPEPLRDLKVENMSEVMEKGSRLVGAAAYDAFSFAGKRTLHEKFHPTSREPLYLVLASRRILGQSVCSMAVWKATHLSGKEVCGPLWRIVKGKASHMKGVEGCDSEVTLVD